MNSEFKKLLEASYTKGFEECARTGHKVGQLDAIFNSIVMAEFAELIVQDNIRILRSNGYDDAAQCLQDIHFGIEDPI